jgi:hypothetical protein
MPPLFLIVGPPAVGKSTTSHTLAARFPKSIHIPVDDIRMMVVSGLKLPSAVWDDELAQQISLARAGVAQMALRYQQAGFAVVIDDFWDAAFDADYALLRNQPNVQRILLYPDQAETHQRNFVRSGDSPARGYIDQGIEIVYQQLRPVVAQLQAQGWQVLDTTRLDVDGVVSAILERADLTRL